MPFVSEVVKNYVPPEEPVKEFTPPKDRAFYADPEKKNLLSAATEVRDLTPLIGTELIGIQLNNLNDKQKNELALLVAERGVVFFRDQSLNLEEQHELAKHYGIQDVDPNQLNPKHVVILSRDKPERGHSGFYNKESNDFHADHSYEINSPSYTLLRMEKSPPTGGDTLFASSYGLYATLSPTYQEFFTKLTAIHSSRRQYIASLENGGKPRREAIDTEHPLVSTHPVTKLRALNYNPIFVESIPQLNKAESDHLLNFLKYHLHTADDIQVRWKWQPGSVAFWDGRAVLHKVIPGYYDKDNRQGFRTAVYSERAKFDPDSEDIITRLEKTTINGK